MSRYHRSQQSVLARTLRPFIVVAFVLPLCACGDRSSAPQAAVEPLPAWSQSALDAQPQLEALQLRSPEGMRPATTDWRQAPLAEDARVLEGATPGRVLHKLSLALGEADLLGSDIWEQTVRVWQPQQDEATGVILSWGLKDDAIVGRDLRVHMRMEENLWRVASLEERFHCRRGVNDGLCL